MFLKKIYIEKWRSYEQIMDGKAKFKPFDRKAWWWTQKPLWSLVIDEMESRQVYRDVAIDWDEIFCFKRTNAAVGKLWKFAKNVLSFISVWNNIHRLSHLTLQMSLLTTQKSLFTLFTSLQSMLQCLWTNKELPGACQVLGTQPEITATDHRYWRLNFAEDIIFVCEESISHLWPPELIGTNALHVIDGVGSMI